MASTDFKDYYAVLAVDRTADADEIKRSFRRLARKYHPDLNPNDNVAEARFKEINEAYEVLSDSDKRKKYDQFGQYWKQAGQGGFGGGGGFEDADFGRFNNFDEFINELLGRFNTPGAGASYGGARPGGRPGAGFPGAAANLDQEAKLALSLREAFEGTKKSIRANGRAIDVNIPAGVKPGSKVRLRGKGMASPYGQQGDLYLIISIQPHPFFQLEGENLACEVPIAPDEAALGTQIAVPTPEGKVTVNVPAGIRSGQSLRLRGKGWPKRDGRGDQLVKVVIATPQNLSPQERELYEKLQAARSSDPRSSLEGLGL
ncbi:MAG: J domain-containing protein [Synechococcales cyanobacterium RM1_1_8]|nr:J domain-containing protein [Synechococcales cyanobacterium RM1_1_8]